VLDDSTEVDAEPEVAPSSIQMPMASPTDEPLIAPALHQRILPDNLIIYTRKPRQQEARNIEVSEFIAKNLKAGARPCTNSGHQEEKTKNHGACEYAKMQPPTRQLAP